MLDEAEIKVLKQTLDEYGLRHDKIDGFVELFIKNLKMNKSFDPDFDDDLEVK